MNVTLLKNSEKNGRPAELMVIDFLKFEGNNVNDLTKDKVFQDIDTDLATDTSLVEVKNESQCCWSGNWVIETGTHKPLNIYASVSKLLNEKEYVTINELLDAQGGNANGCNLKSESDEMWVVITEKDMKDNYCISYPQKFLDRNLEKLNPNIPTIDKRVAIFVIDNNKLKQKLYNTPIPSKCIKLKEFTDKIIGENGKEYTKKYYNVLIQGSLVERNFKCFDIRDCVKRTIYWNNEYFQKRGFLLEEFNSTESLEKKLND